MCFLVEVSCITESAICSSKLIAIDFAMNLLSLLIECGDIPSIVYTTIWDENPSLLTQRGSIDCRMTTVLDCTGRLNRVALLNIPLSTGNNNIGGYFVTTGYRWHLWQPSCR